MRDLNEYSVFLSIAEQGSLINASTQLQMPRSTVSKKLADLERRLGQQLFKRTTRRIWLTRAGELLLQDVSRAVRLIGDAEVALQDNVTGDRPLIVFSAPPLLAQNIVGLVVGELLNRHPQCRVDVRSAVQFDPVRDSDVDIRLSAHPTGRLPKGAIVVANSRRQIFASPLLLARRGTPAVPEDIDPADLIMRQPSEAIELRRGKRRAVLHCRGLLSCPDHETIRDIVITGFCFGVLPKFVAAPHVSSGRLNPVLPDWSFDPIPICVSVSPQAGRSPYISTLISLVSQSLERAGFNN